MEFAKKMPKPKNLKDVVSFDERSKLFYRNNTNDFFLISEQKTYETLWPSCKDKVILDLGANIGSFSNNVLKKKPRLVYAFEPEPDNIEMLKKQPFFESEKFKLFERAISNKNGEAEFYVNSKTNKGAHSLQQRKGREIIKVKTVSFAEVMDKFEPEVVKMDIEGQEIYLEDWKLLKDVQALAIEIHFDKVGRIDRAREMVEFFKKYFDELTTESSSRVDEKKFMQLAFFIGTRKKRSK